MHALLTLLFKSTEATSLFKIASFDMHVKARQLHPEAWKKGQAARAVQVLNCGQGSC